MMEAETDRRGGGETGTRPRQLLTTSEAARLLGVSRPTIVEMCESGDIPFVHVGTHRRIEAEIVRALRDRPKRRLTSSRRSLWLAHAAAGALVLDPEHVLEAARSSLQSMLAAGPRGRSRRWLLRWQELLDGPVDEILDALTGSTVEHDELRQHSPITAALDDGRRQLVLASFQQQQRPRAAGTISPAATASTTAST